MRSLSSIQRIAASGRWIRLEHCRMRLAAPKVTYTAGTRGLAHWAVIRTAPSPRQLIHRNKQRFRIQSMRSRCVISVRCTVAREPNVRRRGGSAGGGGRSGSALPEGRGPQLNQFRGGACVNTVWQTIETYSFDALIYAMAAFVVHCHHDTSLDAISTV